jgi:hypothetical protein
MRYRGTDVAKQWDRGGGGYVAIKWDCGDVYIFTQWDMGVRTVVTQWGTYHPTTYRRYTVWFYGGGVGNYTEGHGIGYSEGKRSLTVGYGGSGNM